MSDTEEQNNGLSFDIMGDNYINMDENPIQETDIEAYKEKIRRSGIVFISYIPENMKVMDIKNKFEKYGVNRIYLVPDKHNKSKKYLKFKEGWVEFNDKLMAKLCEYELNGKMIGGKKRHNPFHDEMWTIKYLHKFKWHHLVEKLGFNRKMREHRIKAEVNQNKRETNFIMEKFLQSKVINKLNKKRQREIDENENGDENKIKKEIIDEELENEIHEILEESKGHQPKNLKVEKMIEDYKNKNKVRRKFRQVQPLNK